MLLHGVCLDRKRLPASAALAPSAWQPPSVHLTTLLQKQGNCVYVHAGSSSEYGDHADQPPESSALHPNSHYSVTKVAVAGLLHYLGTKKGFACANLRLYSVYGPLEDSARLIPNLVKRGIAREYPGFVSPEISRDFVYVEDAAAAFIDTALNLRPELYGQSFNVGTGVKTTIRDLAFLAKEVFGIPADPTFESYENRAWDLANWSANPAKIKNLIGWQATTPLRHGLQRTVEWYKSLPDPDAYEKSSKKYALDTKCSISAVVACYKDGQAIPIMYERLAKVFNKLKIDYEIVFVNDNSPDNSEEVIAELSLKDRRVVGITHARNFGSQAAFRSGMELASKNACVLLDGDLQDPPELIEQFVARWREGHDVVYGRRVKREAPFYMQFAYKAFYYLFEKFSYIKIPRDAGDFSLIDKKVVRCILQFPERDLFLRGVRAFAGFRQIGVDYARPERMFGRSTNNLFKNIGWAKKGILSFSNTPLNILSFFGVVLFGVSLFLITAQALAKVFMPESAPAGFATVIILVIFFGSLNLFALSLVGEYLAKVFEEVKQRPHFIRKHIVFGGMIRDAANDARPSGRN